MRELGPCHPMCRFVAYTFLSVYFFSLPMFN